MEVCVSNQNQKKEIGKKLSDQHKGEIRSGKNKMVGKQSIEFGTPVRIRCSASVVGKKEGQGPLGHLFDKVCTDDTFGTKSWEAAESALQKETVELCLQKSNRKIEDIRYLFAGDLLGQCIASSFGVADNVMCVTSSHFASAEKEFRFPLEYGNQRPLSASWTVIGSGAFLLSDTASQNDRAIITTVTPGRIVDYGLKDSMNMGMCMAPGTC